MPGLLTNSTSQVEIEFDPVTIGHTAVVGALSLVPNIRGGRKVRGNLVVDGVVLIAFTVTFHDVALEEFGPFGERLERRKKNIRF